MVCNPGRERRTFYHSVAMAAKEGCKRISTCFVVVLVVIVTVLLFAFENNLSCFSVSFEFPLWIIVVYTSSLLLLLLCFFVLLQNSLRFCLSLSRLKLVKGRQPEFVEQKKILWGIKSSQVGGWLSFLLANLQFQVTVILTSQNGWMNVRGCKREWVNDGIGLAIVFIIATSLLYYFNVSYWTNIQWISWIPFMLVFF